MNHSITLNALSQRDAIADALYRAVIGIDTNDHALFNSAWVNQEDAVFEMNGNAMHGLNAIHDNMFANIGPKDTTHFITNIRIDVKNDANTATMTAHALAQHYEAGAGLDPASKSLISGSMYWIDVVKDEESDLWRMKKWSMKLVWTEGDMSVVMKQTTVFKDD